MARLNRFDGLSQSVLLVMLKNCWWLALPYRLQTEDSFGTVSKPALWWFAIQKARARVFVDDVERIRQGRVTSSSQLCRFAAIGEQGFI